MSSGAVARRPRAVIVAAKDGRPGRPGKLTGEEMLVIARMSNRGMSSYKIARCLTTPERKISAAVVAAWLRRARTPPEELHMSLAALRIGAVESWDLAMRRGARDGRHAPAKDLLIATKTIEASPDAGRVIVVIGTGAAGAPTLPAMPADLLAVARPLLPPSPVPDI